MSRQYVSDEEAVPLALLSALEGEEVQGATRLQKLVFLAQKGGLTDDPIPEGGFDGPYSFDAYDYGPFCKELSQVVDRLVDKGLIEEREATTRSGNGRKDYIISESGRKTLEEADLSPHARDVLLGVKMLYNDTPLLKLIDDVYSDYERYTVNSKLDLGSL